MGQGSSPRALSGCSQAPGHPPSPAPHRPGAVPAPDPLLAEWRDRPPGRAVPRPGLHGPSCLAADDLPVYVEMETATQQHEKAKVIRGERLERLTQICQQQGVRRGDSGPVHVCPLPSGAEETGGACRGQERVQPEGGGAAEASRGKASPLTRPARQGWDPVRRGCRSVTVRLSRHSRGCRLWPVPSRSCAKDTDRRRALHGRAAGPGRRPVWDSGPSALLHASGPSQVTPLVRPQFLHL